MAAVEEVEDRLITGTGTGTPYQRDAPDPMAPHGLQRGVAAVDLRQVGHHRGHELHEVQGSRTCERQSLGPPKLGNPKSGTEAQRAV